MSYSTKDKQTARTRRHFRVRKKVAGTAERPRLAVYRSHQHIYAQIINDEAGHTLVAASTLEPEIKGDGSEYFGNADAARKIGERIAQKAREKGIESVVFDRGGNKYHGRVAALAVSWAAGASAASATLGAVLSLVGLGVLLAVVFAAVHHADVIAHRTGEPYGTLVLTVAAIPVAMPTCRNVELIPDAIPAR